MRAVTVLMFGEQRDDEGVSKCDAVPLSLQLQLGVLSE